MITNQEIAEDLIIKFGEDAVSDVHEPYGLLTFTTTRENILPMLEYLHNHPKYKHRFLTDLCGIHFPDEKGQELGVIYHIHSFENNHRVRIKTFFSIENPNLPTVSKLYPCADWMERETFDFYGIIFDGHPNLIRILNIEEMDYHPMRKEYPLEDATRQDKIDALFGR